MVVNRVADYNLSEDGMLRNIRLVKPLAFLDLETTGIDPQKDRIVELGILRIDPDGDSERRVWRVNPGVPIPAEATAIHGIGDLDVVDQPGFGALVEEILAILHGCDLCGFNLKRFDLRVLHAECGRVGKPLLLEGRLVLDAMEIYHRREPRDLASAVRFYLDREHDDAHSAGADVVATAAILDAMVTRYNLPGDLADLHREFSDPNAVDSDGFFTRVEGQIRFVKGRCRGQSLEAVAAESPGYLEWMLGQSFPDDTKAVVRAALAKSRSGQNRASRPHPLHQHG